MLILDKHTYILIKLPFKIRVNKPCSNRKKEEKNNEGQSNLLNRGSNKRFFLCYVFFVL